MRLLVVHPRMSIKGGGERVAIHSLQAGLNAGHKVTLISEDFDTSNFEDFFGCKGLFSRIDRVSYPAFRPLVKKGLLLYQRLLYHQIRIRERLSSPENFDVLLGTQDIGYLPDVNIPVLQYCYFPEYFTHLELQPRSPLWRLYYWPASRFYKNRVVRVARFLAVSDYTRDYVEKKWGRESETLYPPCPVETYSDGNKAKDDMVITVGRIVPEKRMHLFVELARELPRYKFVIVGSIGNTTSAYYESLKRTSPENLSIYLSPLRKVKALLTKSKVYVHCAQNEHFGITIVEAMAAGCVPVVHDSGGPREIVNETVGLRWKKMQDASVQVSRVIEDDGLRSRLSSAAVKRAKEYSPEIFESRLARVFEQYGN